MEEHAEGVPAKFSSVWYWATRGADKIREQCQSARFPQVNEYLNYIGESFGETHRLVLSAHAQEAPIPPNSLAISFARIIEFDRRAAALVKSVPITDWPGTAGCSLAQFSGRSGLEVAIAYSTAVRSGLQYTFNWIMTGKGFPRIIEEMPLTGDGMTESFRNWPERAYTELREVTIPAEPVWMMRRDGERVWGAVVLEYERYIDRLVSRSESTKELPKSSRVDAAEEPHSSLRCDIPETRNVLDEIIVDRDQQTLTYKGRTARIGGNVAWSAFVLLYENRNNVIDLSREFERPSRDVANDVRTMLRRHKFDELAKRVVAQSGIGHVLHYP